MASILIKGGTIVNFDKSVEADILIKDNKIENIAKKIKHEKAFKINAKNKYIFPGAIDPHVHLHLKTSTGYSSDDFYTGSLAALAGGTTTLIDFVTPNRGQSWIEALAERKSEAEKCLIDYSFHMSPTWWGENSANEMLQCIKKEGISSFKVYLAYKDSIGIDDSTLLQVFEIAAKNKALVTLHCENGDIIDKLRKDAIKNGNISPRYHYETRPSESESDSVFKAINMSKLLKCPIYIVHVTSQDSLKFIKNAKKNKQFVFAETCPQYLMFNDSVYKQSGFKSAAYVMSPPIRSKKDQKALWENLSSGTISAIGTDHCPFNWNQKEIGENDFTKIPNGAGGIEHRLKMLYTYGVLKGKITLNQMIEICSYNPAKIFGISSRKGYVKEGMDADLVIWNPKIKSKVSVKNHFQNCDIDIYDGIETVGIPETVITKGIVAIDSGSINVGNLKGDFLYRKEFKKNDFRK